MERAVDDLCVAWARDVSSFSHEECDERLARLIAAARAEGARQERERIRRLERDENLGVLLRAAAAATIDRSPSLLSWRALLAAITEGE